MIFNGRINRFLSRAATVLAGAWVLAATAPPAAAADVLTQHNDNSRTGQNLQETILTTANVSVDSFGKIFSYETDGYVYAQPLYKSQVVIEGKGMHDVVFVATQHDTVYAFDADPNQGASAAPLWMTSFLNPAKGMTSVPEPDLQAGAHDIVPEVGITGTPVISTASDTLYVVAKTEEIVGGQKHFVQRLHALNIHNGREKFGGPGPIEATVDGTGDGSANGKLPFLSLKEDQRPGLLLSHGVVYAGYAAHADSPPYHGWVFGFDAKTLKQVAVHCNTPDGSGAGIWQSGAGLAADAYGNLFFATGNGDFNADKHGRDYGDTYEKLSTVGGLTVSDYFTPMNQDNLNKSDADLGSGGVMLLPDQPGEHRHLLVGAGKEGKIYLIDRDAMGRYDTETENVVQTIPQALNHCFDVPAYFNGSIYYVAADDAVKVFRVDNGKLVMPPTSRSAQTFGFPGSTPSISANGIKEGIVWTIEVGTPGALHAYRADNVAIELYNSSQWRRDVPGGGGTVKFSVPTVADGKVFVGTRAGLAVYGLGPSRKPIEPTDLVMTASSPTDVALKWEDEMNGKATYEIERADDSKTFKPLGKTSVGATSYADRVSAADSGFTYRIRAITQRGTSEFVYTSGLPVMAAGGGPFASIRLVDAPEHPAAIDSQRNLAPGRFDGAVAIGAGRVFRYAPHFDGNGSRLVWGDDAKLKFAASDSFTLTAWANVSALPGRDIGIVSREQKPGTNFSLAIAPDNHWRAGGAAPISGTAVTVGWHQLSLVQDGKAKTRTLYVDGKSAGAGKSQDGKADAELWIGGDPGRGNFFDGVVDDIRLYSRPLAAAEVAALAQPVPQPPQQLAVKAAAPARATLRWVDAMDKSNEFTIERSGDGVNFAKIAAVPAGGGGFIDTDLVDGRAYWYRLRGSNAAGDSDFCDKATVTLPADPALVGCWPLDEGSGTKAADTSDNHLDGQVEGETAWTTGKVGRGALTFHGIGNAIAHVTIKDDPKLRFKAQESFDISLWMNAEQGTGHRHAVVSKSRDAGAWVGLWITADGQIAFEGPAGAVSGGPLRSGWHHVVAEQNGPAKTRRLWVDGVVVGSGPAQDADGPGDLWIGAAKSVEEPFSGSADDVRVYRRVLSDGEITLLSQQARPESPAELTAKVMDAGVVQLAWKPLKDQSAAVQVERSADGAKFAPAGVVNLGAADFSDRGLTPGNYSYRVRATNGYGASETSAAVDVVIPARK